MRPLFFLLVLLPGWALADGTTALISAGERAVIEFGFDGPPLADNGEAVNVLILSAGGSYVDFLGDSQLRQQLYDGPQLLASREAARLDGMTARFIDQSVPWTGVDTVFSSIQDGSIAGRLLIEPQFDQPGFQSRIRLRGELITGWVGDDGSFSPGPTATISQCAIQSRVFADRFDALARDPLSGGALRPCDG
ncbi:MAG: hypothetical protein ACXIUB_10375 [Wenzhouxiangella sp.]